MNIQELGSLTTEGAAEGLDAAVYESDAYFEIESKLPWASLDLGQAPTEPRELAASVSAAFQYAARHGLRKRGLSPFIPMFTLEDGTEIPPSPKNVSAAWGSNWDRVATAAVTPAARARLNDLLFSRGAGQVGDYAKAAIGAYLELSEADWHSLDKASGLLRSREIAKITKMRDLEMAILDRMSAFAADALRMREGPGVVLDLLETLLSESDYADRSISLLRESLDTYSPDPFTVDQILVMLRDAASSDDLIRTQLESERVDRWLASAGNREGAEKLFDLERAVQIADYAGLTDKLSEARTALQNFDADGLHLQRSRRTLELPDEAVREYVRQFVAADGWREALVAAALHTPLTGNIEETYSAIEESRRVAPLTHELPRVKLGSDGLPRWKPSTEEEKEDDRLARQETLFFQMAAPLFANGLDEVGKHYEISATELTAFFIEQPSSTDRIAEVVSRALQLYWQGSFSESAYLAVWQIESVCREILLAADRGIYQTQRKRHPGQYPGLGQLVKQLGRLGLDQSWYRYLWTVFASPAGLNLRNELAHGFIGEISKPIAAATLHAIMYLCLVDGRTSSNEA